MTAKSKLAYWGLKLTAIASSVGAPIAAVLQRFPLYKITTERLSAGGVMVLVIVLFGFRRKLWPLIAKKLHITYVGEFLFWGVLFFLILWLERIVAVLPDLRTICLVGLAGSGAGQIAETAADKIEKAGKASEDSDG